MARYTRRRQTDNPKKPAGAARKPNSVSGKGRPLPDGGHSSEDDGCPPSLATYPGTRTGRPRSSPYLVLHRVGFAELPRSPGKLVRSYRTVSPLPATKRNRLIAGGMLSVALSFALPRLHVMEHPALWCSDFPPAPTGPAIAWTAPTAVNLVRFLSRERKSGSFSFTRKKMNKMFHQF